MRYFLLVVLLTGCYSAPKMPPAISAPPPELFCQSFPNGRIYCSEMQVYPPRLKLPAIELNPATDDFVDFHYIPTVELDERK